MFLLFTDDMDLSEEDTAPFATKKVEDFHWLTWTDVSWRRDLEADF